jgi:hypothetical protein
MEAGLNLHSNSGKAGSEDKQQILLSSSGGQPGKQNAKTKAKCKDKSKMQRQKQNAKTKARCGGSSPFDFAQGQNDNGFWIVRKRTTATARCGLANSEGSAADFSAALLTMMP